MTKKFLVTFLVFLLCLSGCGKEEWLTVDTYHERYDIGVKYLEEENYEDAICAFTAAIEIDAMQPEIYEKRAEAYLLSEISADDNYFNLAIEDYLSAINTGADEVQIRNILGTLYLDRGEYTQAAEQYEFLTEHLPNETSFDALLKIYSSLGNCEAIAKVAQNAYTVIGSDKYKEIMWENWKQDALLAYDAFLGFDETVAFSLVDLDQNAVPELITGPISDYGSDAPVTLLHYSLYSYQNSSVISLVENQDIEYGDPDYYSRIFASPAGAIISSNSGATSASYDYMIWDGVQLTKHNTVSSFGGLYIDGHSAAEGEYDEIIAPYTENQEQLVFYPNTTENALKYLRTDRTEKIKAMEEMAQTLHPIMKMLNTCVDESLGFRIGTTEAYNRTVHINDYSTYRLYQGQFTDLTLAENEVNDPIGITYFVIPHYSTEAEMYAYYAPYMAENVYMPLIKDTTEVVNGIVYMTRGGRGYGALSFDLDTFKIESLNETVCTATCDRMLFEHTLDSSVALTFEKHGNSWILTSTQDID